MSNDKELWLANMTAAIKKLEKARLYLNKWQDELEAAEAEIAELAAQTQPTQAQSYNVQATVTSPEFNYATQV